MARHVLGGQSISGPTLRTAEQGWYQALVFLVRWRGHGPLSIVRCRGANVHDAKLLEATLDAIVVEVDHSPPRS